MVTDRQSCDGPEPAEAFVGTAAVLDGICGMLAQVEAMTRGSEAPDPFGEPAFPQWRYTLRDGTIVRGVDPIAFQD